jgi:hypothetical protein
MMLYKTPNQLYSVTMISISNYLSVCIKFKRGKYRRNSYRITMSQIASDILFLQEKEKNILILPKG